MRNTRLLASAIAATAFITACNSDSVTTPYTPCAGQPGCQESAAAVAPEVLQSLDDANSRALTGLQSNTRSSIEAPLDKLKTALTERNIDGGRAAFLAAINAIDQAERANPELAPDLGVVRLGLVPAARSLGLPVSSVEAPTR